MSLGYSPVLQPPPPCSHSPSSAHVSFKDTCHWIKVHRVFPSEPTFTGLGPMLLKPHPAHTHPPRDLLTREPPDGARWPWARTTGSDHQSMEASLSEVGKQPWAEAPAEEHSSSQTRVYQGWPLTSCPWGSGHVPHSLHLALHLAAARPPTCDQGPVSVFLPDSGQFWLCPSAWPGARHHQPQTDE